MTEDKADFPAVDPLKAAWSASCPRCGTGKLFDGFTKPAPRCTACGLDYSFIDAGDGPAIFVILLADVLVLGLALWLEFTFEPSIWLHILFTAPVGIVFTLWLMRFLKALLIVMQYRNNASQGVIDRD